MQFNQPANALSMFGNINREYPVAAALILQRPSLGLPSFTLDAMFLR